MVKDTEGILTWEPGQGVLVGKWSRAPYDGLIHVSLNTPIDVLRDKAIQKFAEYAEMRKEVEGAPKAKKGRTPRAPKAAPEPSEALTTISNLRKLLSK